MSINFTTGSELLSLCNKNNIKIFEMMLVREVHISQKNKDQIKNEMKESLEVMKGLLKEALPRISVRSAAIGYLITRNATVSGAEGGCQAETGAAAAMAAAAIVEMLGGTPAQALDAAAIAIKNIMGLVCDPIAGLVEAPCIKRNAIGTANALISADLALAGITSIIPFDEVVEAMLKVGRALPCELRETGTGGLAGTPTGKQIHERIFGKVNG